VQQRLENRIENTTNVQQNPTFNFGTNPAAALLAEARVDDHERTRVARSQQGATMDDGAMQDDAVLEFQAVASGLIPWLELARRLNDPTFAQAVTDGAAAGSPADDPRLLPRDVRLLRRVQRPGTPFDVDAVRGWASENALRLDAVRDTLRAGSAAAPESLRVATKFAEQLFSDLQRRGLIATT
jgi:hypothetical protein